MTHYDTQVRALLSTALFLLLTIPALAGQLHDAVRSGDLALVKTIVLMAPDAVNETDSAGKTPLHIAAEQGYDAIAMFLLSRKAQLEAADHYGATPLYYAARRGKARMVLALIRRGATPRVSSNDGLTPLHWAALYGYNDVVHVLIDHGADVNARSTVQGNTPLMETWGENHSETAGILLDHGADINAVETRFGFSILHFAVVYGREQLVATLVAHHPDLSIKGRDGFTPAMLAAETRNSRIAALLGTSVPVPMPRTMENGGAIPH